MNIEESVSQSVEHVSCNIPFKMITEETREKGLLHTKAPDTVWDYM